MTLYRIDLERLAVHPTAYQMATDLRALDKTHVLVPVKPVEMLVECPNRVDGDPQAGCDKCGGEGFIIAPVVVVEDTE